jgi:hypothetical protein
MPIITPEPSPISNASSRSSLLGASEIVQLREIADRFIGDLIAAE